jgi:hypothetical protein
MQYYLVEFLTLAQYEKRANKEEHLKGDGNQALRSLSSKTLYLCSG